MAVRVNLYFPDDHWVADIPVERRASELKRLVELAKYNEILISIKDDLVAIKSMLSQRGVLQPIPPVQSKEAADADKELILSILGM